jgi:predicted 2-oxoglutarate/Fe(II)-dependent dioxygenase YbiX
MSTSPARRRHLASSPFKPDPEPVIEQYETGDLVSHDTYGLGRVVGVDAGAVTVSFGAQTLRIPSPFQKMAKL